MNDLIEKIKAFGPTRVGGILSILLIIISFFVFMTLSLTEQSFQLLYGQLEDQDAKAIVRTLRDRGISYELRNQGSDVYVPERLVDGLRVSFAEEGISGEIIGYEIFDRQDSLGQTSFEMQLNRLRALEGELARTINSLSSVQSSRVHLVLSQREVFDRSSNEPSASVALKLKKRSIPEGEIKAIQYLIANAVSKLEPSQVSIVDSNGNLLAQSGQGDDPYSPENFTQLRLQYEQELRSRVENLLQNTIGFGKVRAEIQAKMDYSETTINSEIYDPDRTVVRSTEVIEEQTSTNDSNPSVTVQNNVPDQPNPFDGTQDALFENSNREETRTNNEVSREVKTVVIRPGKIENLSVGILIDGIYTLDGNGEKIFSPRPQEQIDQIKSLVISALGMDIDGRGDKLEIISMPFGGFNKDIFETQELYLGLTSEEVKKILELLVLALVGVLVMVTIVRPLFLKIFDNKNASTLSARDRLLRLAEEGTVSERQGMVDEATIFITDQTTGRQVPAYVDGDGRVQPIPAGAAATLAETGRINSVLGEANNESISQIDRLLNLDRIDSVVKESAIAKIVEIIDKHPEQAVVILRNWMLQDNQ